MRLPAYQDLSKEQDQINNLPLDGSHLIAGPPGTGKTVVALYRASMLTQKKASPTLLMHSRLLLQYTSAASEALGIDGSADTFHAWFCKLYWKLYNREPPQIEPYKFDWTKVLTKVNQVPPAQNRVPYLLIDEAQDLPKLFFPVARILSRHLTIFADENQRLLDDNSTIDEIRNYSQIDHVHYLTRNYRNTAEIAALAARFYTGLETGIPALPARHGEKPSMTQYKDLNATVEAIVRFEHNYPDLEIGVFAPTKSLRKKLAKRLTGKTKNPIQSFEGSQGADAQVLNFGVGGIKLVTYQSAKGLEFDAVFIPELQELTDDPNDPVLRMRFYVLISRARDRLFLSYSGPDGSRVVDMFPEELLERL